MHSTHVIMAIIINNLNALHGGGGGMETNEVR